MWIPTGSTLLNLAISQNALRAFRAGRVHRITGESSATKSGLAASAFFLGALLFSREGIPFKFIYDDSEQTFDLDYYARAYPFLDNFIDRELILRTGEDASSSIEEFAKRFHEFLEECQTDEKIGFYFVDSLDALPPATEISRFEKEGLSTSVNAATKAILLSQFFQDTVAKMFKAQVGLVMVSQVRDNIQFNLGRNQPTKRVSGGNAPQFYSSLVIYLRKRKEESIDLGKEKAGQSTGMRMKAAEILDIEFTVVKNKLGRPFLSGFFSFNIASGAIDDARDLVEFLKQVGVFEKSGSWWKYNDQSYRTSDLEELVAKDIHTFRKLAEEYFLKQLDQTKVLTDISTLW